MKLRGYFHITKVKQNCFLFLRVGLRRIKKHYSYRENYMTTNKKKPRQKHNLWQIFEICGSPRFFHHLTRLPFGSRYITVDKRFSYRALPKLPTPCFGNFVYAQTLGVSLLKYYRFMVKKVIEIKLKINLLSGFLKIIKLARILLCQL